jgi:hypothetical protein
LTTTTTIQATFEIQLINKTEQIGKINFDQAFLEATDLAFSLLGASGKQAVYNILEKKYGLTRIGIPNKIEVFANAVRNIFGGAAALIEMSIMRLLFEKVHGFKYYPGKGEFSFRDYVEFLRLFYCDSE